MYERKAFINIKNNFVQKQTTKQKQQQQLTNKNKDIPAKSCLQVPLQGKGTGNFFFKMLSFHTHVLFI